MKVELRLGGLISVDGRGIALGQTHALLDGLAEERSVSGAAVRLGLSYRTAWGRVMALEEALGRPVAAKTKGHGTVLTEFGAALRDALGATLNAFGPLVAEQERLLSARLAALAGEARPGVRLALSHDPLLLDALSDMPDIVASVVGSHEAVALLRSGGTDAAGFHAGALRISSPPFDRLVDDPAYVVTPLFTREQGLMVAPGNPLSIHAVEDLARTGARFVNRQRGSGTRAWFDRLLAEARIPTAAVTGYDVEEFTHQAVAAVVAAGAADAGMGVRSVAERFGLAFAPIGQETYCLAERRDAACPVADRIRDRVRALVRRMPGYGPAAGTEVRPAAKTTG